MCNTHSELMLFTNRGRVFQIKAYEIPESSRTAKGLPIVNLIQTEQGETVTSVLSKGGEILSTDEDGAVEQTKRDYKYLFMTTKYGTVKKTEMSQFENIRSNGLISIKLESGDELKWVQPTTGKDDIILVTRDGKSIRFHETDVRDTGRNTMGVTGIRFKNKEDEVISMDTLYADIIDKFDLKVEEDESNRGESIEDKGESEKADETEEVQASADIPRLFTLSESGFGKMTLLTEYSSQRRGGTGVFTFKVRPKTGKLVVAKVIYRLDGEIIVMSTQGQVIRSALKGIRTLNRQTSGVKVMNLNSGDTVAAMASR